MIGIDDQNWLVYEGVSRYGRGLWPTPLLSPALLVESETVPARLPMPARLDQAQLVFREDSFALVACIRCG